MKGKNLLKKVIFPCMMAMLLVGVTACGNGTQGSTEKGTDAKDVSAAEETGETASYDISDASLVLKVGSTFNTGSILCDSLEHMCDLIEQETNGDIQFERYFGGTLYTLPEEFEYLTSGSVDLASPMQGFAATSMPLWQLGTLGIDSSKGVDIFNYIANEDETTAPLLQAQAEAAGVHPFGFNIGDYNVVVCKASASSLEDLKGRAFGIPAQGAAVYEQLGLNVVTCETADAYESLSRGVVDTFTAGISSVTSMRLYENAESCIVIPATGGTGICMMNSNSWNKLTEEQQEIFTKAYEETVEWMKERYDSELLPEYEAELAENCEVVYLSGDDLADFMAAKEASAIAQYENAAEILGCTEDYNTVQTMASEYATKVNAE